MTTVRQRMGAEMLERGSVRRSYWRGGMRAMVAAGLAALMVQTVAPALAADQLRSAVLRPSDAPAGFSHPYVKMYTHFRTRLEVATRAGGTRSTAACALPRSFSRYGWRRGLIEAFDVTGSPMTLELCASVFKTPVDAHAAYLDYLRATLTPLLTYDRMKRLPIHGIGDEAMAIGGPASTCNCGGMRATQEYGMILRLGAVVVDLAYVGPSSLAPTQFVRLGHRIDSRLR